MKFLTIFSLQFLLLSNFLKAETILTKSKIIKLSRECLENSQNKGCGELVSQIEKLQFVEFDQNRFKCQSSLLGLQSEIIEVYFLKNFSNKRNSFMIPYVVKNC